MDQQRLKKLVRIGELLGAFFTVGAVVFAVSVYTFMGEVDRNLAYMALYNDGLAVDLYESGASFDAIIMIEGQAKAYCDLYLAERRTLDEWRYKPICDVIDKRGSLFVYCSDDQYADLCTDSGIAELDSLLEIAEPLGKELEDNPTYFSLAFSDDPLIGKTVCYVGSEEVPCPWTQLTRS